MRQSSRLNLRSRLGWLGLRNCFSFAVPVQRRYPSIESGELLLDSGDNPLLLYTRRDGNINRANVIQAKAQFGDASLLLHPLSLNYSLDRYQAR